jgi:hypothetical protein
MNVLVTGSGGLIGPNLVGFSDPQAPHIIDVGNNMRADFFGEQATPAGVSNDMPTRENPATIGRTWSRERRG